MRSISPGSCSYAGMGYANPHAVTSVGGTSYTYDNNGNVTAIGSLDYTWNWRNRLASAERSGGGITTYGYDHTGQRVSQATGSATTSYPNRYYNVASSSLAATTTKHIFTPGGELLATVVGSGTSTASTTYLHPDHLGGTNVVTDEDGEVAQTLDFNPYGSQRIATGSFDEQRRFIGEEFDGDTEFSYLNARYYQGSRGQFMSQDPMHLDIGDPGFEQRYNRILRDYLADPQQMNSYGYARNNPITNKDPTGEGLERFLLDVIYGLSQARSGVDFADSSIQLRSSFVGGSRTSQISSGIRLGVSGALLFTPLAPIGAIPFLWEGFNRAGELLTGVDLDEELARRALERDENSDFFPQSINPSIFQPNWNLFNVGNSSPSATSLTGGSGGGTISVQGTSIPRSANPVGFEKSGAPIFCWGACN